MASNVLPMQHHHLVLTPYTLLYYSYMYIDMLAIKQQMLKYQAD